MTSFAQSSEETGLYTIIPKYHICRKGVTFSVAKNNMAFVTLLANYKTTFILTEEYY